PSNPAERAADHSRDPRMRSGLAGLVIERRRGHMAATRVSTIRRIGLTLCLTLSLSTAATSSSFAYSARAQQMCTGDAFRLCTSEIPNIARIIACMRRNKANLSPGCRAVMDQEDTAASKPRPAPAAPVVQKPATASHVEPPAAVEAKPVQAAPVAQKPVTASPVEPPAVVEAKPVRSEERRVGKEGRS